MPQKPRKGQSRESYMSSCVRELKAEGKDPRKAREQCFAVWMQNKRRRKK